MSSRTVLLALACVLTNLCHGQDTDTGATDGNRICYGIYASSAFRQDGRQPMGLHLSVDYRALSKTFVFIRGGSTLCVSDGAQGQPDVCTHSSELGVGLRHELLHATGDMRRFMLGSVEPHVYVGHTLGPADWSYTLYECGFSLAFRRHSTYVATFGYRYYDSRKEPDLKGFYVSLGLRL